MPNSLPSRVDELQIECANGGEYFVDVNTSRKASIINNYIYNHIAIATYAIIYYKTISKAENKCHKAQIMKYKD